MENTEQCQVCLRIDNCYRSNDTNSTRPSPASSPFICRNCWDIPNTDDIIDTNLHVDQLMYLTAAAETSHLTKYATDHYREEITLTDGRYSNINEAQNNNICLSNSTLSNDDANKFINKTMDKKCSLVNENDDDKHGSAEFICTDCGDFLCAMCRNAHAYTRQTRNHTVKTLCEFNDVDKLEDMEKNCKLHQGESFQLFCTYCLEIICSICHDENHSDHRVLEISKTNVEFIKFIETEREKDETNRVKYVEEIAKLRNFFDLLAKKQKTTALQVKTTFFDNLKNLKSICDELTTRYEDVENDIMLTIRENMTEQFEEEIRKYENELNKINYRITQSRLNFCETSTGDKADLVKQMKTKSQVYKNSQLLQQNVFERLNTMALFVEPKIEFNKTHQKVNQYSLLSFGSEIKLPPAISDKKLLKSSISAFGGQLLISCNKTNILIANSTVKTLDKLVHDSNAVLCATCIAAISNFFIHHTQVRLFSSSSGSCIATMQKNFPTSNIIKMNYTNGELLIITPNEIFLAKLPSVERNNFVPVTLQLSKEENETYIHAINVTVATDDNNLYNIWVIAKFGTDFLLHKYTGELDGIMSFSLVTNSSCSLFQDNELKYADMAFDGVDKVFISDKVGSAVHVFSSDGIYERQILSSDNGINSPLLLAFDISKSQLYVLLENNVLKQFTLEKLEYNKICYKLIATI